MMREIVFYIAFNFHPYQIGKRYSQLFFYSIHDDRFESLGPLQIDFDLEGFDVHPHTQILYACSGQLDAQLYTVDALSGVLSLVGDIGFDNVKGLAFHPSGQLWGGSDQGLLQINTDTAVGTVFGPTPPGSINSLAWNQKGTKLFATTKTPPRASTLWVYDNSNDWQIACEGLPKKVESLETLPDGALIYGFHQDAKLGIHTFDVDACETIAEARIETPFNDIEGIAWPDLSCHPSNLDFLRAYLENLDGVEKVDIQPSGAISVTMNGEIHQSQLAETVISGTPPADGQLIMTPIEDQNNDGIDDFYITYPSGDQQVMYYFGVKTNEPDDCKILVVPPP